MRPDYSSKLCWARFSEIIDKPVDVFYLYPTVFSDSVIHNMDIYDARMRIKTEPPLNSQLSVYASSANIFVPFYRQMSGTLLDYSGDIAATEYYATASGDVLSAFRLYLEKYNADRPFILAGHSQGSMLLLEILHDQIMADPVVNRRLVAAYLIGYSVLRADTEKYPWMRFASSAVDTGVIVSYNTQSPCACNSPVLFDGAFCINPLNWSIDGTRADRSMNKGAVFYGKDGSVSREIKSYCGAYINTHNNALIAEPPDKLDERFFAEGIYHIYDYALWYRNLQKNVERRVLSYLKKCTDS